MFFNTSAHKLSLIAFKATQKNKTSQGHNYNFKYPVFHNKGIRLLKNPYKLISKFD